MAVHSQMIALGTVMPTFELPDLAGAPVRSADLAGSARAGGLRL